LLARLCHERNLKALADSFPASLAQQHQESRFAYNFNLNVSDTRSPQSATPEYCATLRNHLRVTSLMRINFVSLSEALTRNNFCSFFIHPTNKRTWPSIKASVGRHLIIKRNALAKCSHCRCRHHKNELATHFNYYDSFPFSKNPMGQQQQQ